MPQPTWLFVKNICLFCLLFKANQCCFWCPRGRRHAAYLTLFDLRGCFTSFFSPPQCSALTEKPWSSCQLMNAGGAAQLVGGDLELAPMCGLSGWHRLAPTVAGFRVSSLQPPSHCVRPMCYGGVLVGLCVLLYVPPRHPPPHLRCPVLLTPIPALHPLHLMVGRRKTRSLGW